MTTTRLHAKAGVERRERMRRWYPPLAAAIALATLVVLIGRLAHAPTHVSPAQRAASRLVTPVPPKGATAPWRLVFNDSFSGRRLDTTLWHTCYDYGACQIAHNGEYEWYAPSGVTEGGGVLQLTASANPTHGMPVTSGMIQSNGRFDFRYGYIEIKARVPSGYGTWPALWLLPADGRWPPEIDVMEYWGWDPGVVRESLFLPGDRAGIHHGVAVPNLEGGYHVFGLDWEPGRLAWYVDGHLEFVLDENVDTLMYPIANLAAASPPGGLAANTFPATFRISYIRVYQHPGVGNVVCSLNCEASAAAVRPAPSGATTPRPDASAVLGTHQGL